jgi:phosphatidylinositol glycan class M
MFKNSRIPLISYGLNPILIYLTMRGSCESISCFLMFLMVALQKKVFWAGVVFGFWVHFRVYPVIFGVGLLLYYGRNGIRNAAVFVAGSAIGFLPIVAYYYSLYGYQFLHESYLYHLSRVDNRHNLSAYWYWTYLTMG